MKKYIYLFVMLALSACQKDFLDQKPDQSLLIPRTLADMQALLDNQIMNVTPAIGIISDDDFYTTQGVLTSFSTPIERNAFVWAPDIYEAFQNVSDWNTPYSQVFYANVILRGLEEINDAALTRKNEIKGAALFARAQAFFQLTQLFCKPYSPENRNELGIVLKLNPEINEKVSRANIETSYQQILTDLEEAIPLLPTIVVATSRPSKAAGFALLSKVKLAMGNYQDALASANEALNIQNALIDYNTLSITASQPFPIALPLNNPEVIWFAQTVSYSFLSSTGVFIDSTLYSSYQNNDLRRNIFFTNQVNRTSRTKGRYTGNLRYFGGIATDEVYLIKAECLARLNNATEAMQTLNLLLEKRFRRNTFVPLTATNPENALDLVLLERRKELIGRGTRWMDLRRFQNDPRLAKTLRRNLSVTYSLSPNDVKYTLPIPLSEVNNSGISQNPR